MAEVVLKKDSHLSEEQKQLKQAVNKMFEEYEKSVKELNLNPGDFQSIIKEHFNEIKNKIELHCETLKKRLDEIASKMLEKTREKEKHLIDRTCSNFANQIKDTNETEKNALLEQFRYPNMVVDDIKQSLNDQEKRLKALTGQLKDLKLQLTDIEFIQFSPFPITDRELFGNLNLNEGKTRLVSCSDDTTIKIWDLESFKCEQTLDQHTDVVWRIQKLLNNQILSCSKDTTIKLWDVESGHCLKTFKNGYEVCCLKILSQNMFASGSKGGIKIWNFENKKCIKTLKGHNGFVRDLLLLPNGSLVSCSEDKTIKVWNIEEGSCTKTLNGHKDMVFCLLLLNNGNLASGSVDATIKIWDLESSDCFKTLVGHTHSIWSLKQKKSGELISGSEDKSIKIWNLDTQRCIRTLFGHSGGIECINLYQENFIISGSVDSKIKVWDLRKDYDECIQTLTGHLNNVGNLILI